MNKMEKNTQIKNIIFDLSEVLLTGLKGTGLALGEKHNIVSEHHPLWAMARTPLLLPVIEEFFNGNVSEEDYIVEVLNKWPQLGTKEWLKEHIRENFREINGTRDIVIELKKLGYKLAILSIHGKEWIEYCENKFDFHKLFDVCSYSYQTKVSKPDPLAFQNVLNDLDAKPEECLFIDDSEHNTKAAEALGIQSVVFTDAENLSIRLKELLPNFLNKNTTNFPS